ncbi:MAG TPA: SDR family NAD(P)-dependent oxidoreductase, partial [Vicinamibacteria bacterium]|nr:SDR family NAD(P)-dependent oxidoreductase [Vicinamibacteria bacterium]
MEQLTGIRTLRGIADWLEKALEGGTVQAEPAPASTGVAAPTTVPPVPSPASERPGAPQAARPTGDGELVVIPRSMLAIVDAPPLRGQGARFAPDRVLLVTDDGRGIAQTIGEELQGLGGRVVLLRHAGALAPTEQLEPAIYRADLADAGAVARLVEQVRRDHGPLGGIVHLLPLAVREDFDAMDLAGWRAALARDVKSLFHLARAAAPDLKQAGTGRDAWVLAATTMGGAYDDEPSRRGPFFPGQGGIAGFVKSLALEWPGVQCKVVGLDAESPAALQAEQLLAELTAADGLVEVGYRGAQRRVLQPRLAVLDAGAPVQVPIDADSVVLVTGGARGITAEVAAELAERYRPTLVLVGRSPLPEPEESPATRELASPHGLKAALLERMRLAGSPVSVAQVEAAYQGLLKDREIRASLARMERAGSRVSYVQADARDERAMRSLVDGIYREHGRLDGVIHGAGVIEDKLVEDKTPESFDRVFDTKTESAFILSRVLRADSLRFFALFGSASGPFGNRGQADYSAANEVLNKLALHLGRTWPGRVVCLSWGPWHKTGMVSPELQREFAKRGIDLISIPTGCRLFDQELRHGRRGENEVILAGGAWSTPRAEAPAPAARALPLLHGATFTGGGSHVVEAIRTLDPAFDLYLVDHSMDGSPVLPLAVASELMAELVQKSWPDLQVVGVRELQLLKGVVLDNGPRPVRVIARAQVEPPPDRQGIDVNVEIRDVNASGPLHYRATVELAPELPEAPLYTPANGDGLRPFPMSVAEAYRQWLFHGPRLQAITEIEGISERGTRAILDASAPPPALRGQSHPRWLIDPVIFDSGLQLFLLWARAHLDKTPLPSRFTRYRRFGSLSDTKLTCHLQILERSRDPLYYMNV